MNRLVKSMVIIQHVRFLLLSALLLPALATAFQYHNLPKFRCDGLISRKPTCSSSRVMPVSENDDLILLSPQPKQKQQLCLPMILLSTAVGFGLCGTPQHASAAETETGTADQLIVNEKPQLSAQRPGMSVSAYLNRVFQSPTPGATPLPTDPRYDSTEARNRAYDAAFEQDARDRDAYYGKMAALKREQALQEVRRNRVALGLDGDGDVRPRVGDEKEAGLASLREYLLKQDPSTLTPAELKVYEQMKGAQ